MTFNLFAKLNINIKWFCTPLSHQWNFVLEKLDCMHDLLNDMQSTIIVWGLIASTWIKIVLYLHFGQLCALNCTSHAFLAYHATTTLYNSLKYLNITNLTCFTFCYNYCHVRMVRQTIHMAYGFVQNIRCNTSDS